MNICLLIGKICSNIQFDFILNSKDISVVMFDIELTNGSIIKVKGYNEMADYCYSNLEIGHLIVIEGTINQNMEIVLSMIKNLE